MVEHIITITGPQDVEVRTGGSILLNGWNWFCSCGKWQTGLFSRDDATKISGDHLKVMEERKDAELW